MSSSLVAGEPATEVAYLRLRGLPFDATESDIAEFFAGFELLETFICKRNGRSTGEAYVQLPAAEDAARALSERNGHHIGVRYIELFEAEEAELTAAKQSASKARQRRGEGFVVRCRGLPFTASVPDLLHFFEGIPVIGAERGVHFVYNADGQFTGEAYVDLPSHAALQAALQRDKAMLGQRYIELFPSSRADLVSALTRSRAGPLPGWQRGAFGGPMAGPVASQFGRLGLGGAGEGLPGHSATLKLRGLPYSAGVQEVTDFFAGFHLAPVQPVHIVLKLGREGLPTGSGVAYVQFADAAEAARARQARHRQTMGTRYIECLLQAPSRAPPPTLAAQATRLGHGSPTLPLSAQAPALLAAEYGRMPQQAAPQQLLLQQQQQQQQQYILQQQMLQQQAQAFETWGAYPGPLVGSPNLAWYKGYGLQGYTHGGGGGLMHAGMAGAPGMLQQGYLQSPAGSPGWGEPAGRLAAPAAAAAMTSRSGQASHSVGALHPDLAPVERSVRGAPAAAAAGGGDSPGYMGSGAPAQPPHASTEAGDGRE